MPSLSVERIAIAHRYDRNVTAEPVPRKKDGELFQDHFDPSGEIPQSALKKIVTVEFAKKVTVREVAVDDDEVSFRGLQRVKLQSLMTDDLQRASDQFEQAMTAWRTPRQWFLDQVGDTDSKRAKARAVYDEALIEAGCDVKTGLSRVVREMDLKDSAYRSQAAYEVPKKNPKRERFKSGEDGKIPADMMLNKEIHRHLMRLESAKIQRMSEWELEDCCRLQLVPIEQAITAAITEPSK